MAAGYHQASVKKLKKIISAKETLQTRVIRSLKVSDPKQSNTSEYYDPFGGKNMECEDFLLDLELNKRVLDDVRKMFGDEHSKTAEGYYLLGLMHYSLGDFISAFETTKRAVDIQKKLFGEVHLKTADSYDLLGLTQQLQGDFTSALESNKHALSIRKKLLGEEHSKTADSYYSLGVTQHSLGDFISALASNKCSLKIRLKLFGAEHPKTAESYYSLGTTQHSLGDFISALESDMHALDIRLKLFGEEHSKTADSYYALGVTQHSLGDFMAAWASNKRALDIRLKLLDGQHSKTAESYDSLGVTQHSPESVTPSLESSKHTTDRGLKLFREEHSKTANSYYSLGVTQHSLGHVMLAIESNKCALEIRRNLFGEEHPKTADSYDLLGLMQHEQGDFNSALQSHKCALNIRRKLLGEEHPKTADSYYSLGVTQHSLGDFKQAQESHKCALSIRRKLLGEEHPKTADSHCSLGVTQHSLGDFKQAQESLKCALGIRRKLLGEEHPKTADSYYSLGVTQHSLGDFHPAQESHKCALSIRRKLLGEVHPKTADNYFSLRVTQHTVRDYISASEDHSDTAEQHKSDQCGSVAGPVLKPTHFTKERKVLTERHDGHDSENDLRTENTMAMPEENEVILETVAIVNWEGREVVGEDVHFFCPNGAIDKSDCNVAIKIHLEKPSRHCDMIVKNGLENDVTFITPVINLQPNGQVFKKPVTVTTKLATETDASVSNVLILHGTQARDGKVFWEDITCQSKIDLEKKELKVEINGFSLIAGLLRLTSILAKDVVTRLNLLGFNYTLSLLFKDNHPHSPFGELALVFMSHDIYHETCYREHPSSVLMQFKANGYEELSIIDRPESSRIYNNENLKISLLLGQDYKLTDEQLESTDFIVNSSTWWSTGHVIKRSLKGTDGVRILCGKIAIEGQYGHVLGETFCALDTCEYVRQLLRVEGSILNLVPIARKLEVPQEATDDAIKSWQKDEEQLKMILRWWKGQDDCDNKDPAMLRNALQGLNSEDCEVDKRGKMHINHLRELACEIQSLNREDPHLIEYFANQIRTLCDSILQDCCIELGADVSTENYPRFLSFHQRVTDDVAQKLEKICSSSTRSINKDFLSIVPFLIQAIKDIFPKEKPLIEQNGLKGLPKEMVSRHESEIRDAFLNKDILRLLCEVSEVLGSLCLNNCEKHSTEEIKNWIESLGIWNMSQFLKKFFQSRQDNKLHKRLQLFSRSMRRILVAISDVKEIEMRYLCNVSLNLIKFARFDPSKLVRFEMTDCTNSPVTCYSEAIKYDRPHDTFSQQFEIRKESEDELQLGAIARVHLDGRIHKVGAFETVMVLPSSNEEEIASSLITTLPVEVKTERTGSGDLRVVLSSTRRKTISEALCVLQRELGDDIVDGGQVEITESPLTVCCFVEAVGVVRLRLLYKWRSEAISVDSKDFVAIGESSATDASTSASDSVTESSSPLEAELAALSIASCSGDKNGNFVMDPSTIEMIQRHARQQCGRLELHLHQTIQKGHVCVTGENTSLHMEMPKTAQGFLQAGLCAPSQKSITAGPSSNEGAVSEQQKNQSVVVEEIED